jgi:hypothetical protein
VDRAKKLVQATKDFSTQLSILQVVDNLLPKFFVKWTTDIKSTLSLLNKHYNHDDQKNDCRAIELKILMKKLDSSLLSTDIVDNYIGYEDSLVVSCVGSVNDNNSFVDSEL